MSEIAGGRTPPQNLDAERSALGGVLIKPSAVDELVTGLTADDFFLPAHREIFESMLSLEKRRQPIDVVSLADDLRTRGVLPRLEGGEAYLMTLAASVPTAENIAHYIRIVREKATLRRLISACAEIQSRAFGEFGEYEQFLDEAETAVFKVVQQTRKDNYTPVGDMMGTVLESIEERARERKSITGVPTGFAKFDEITAGLQPENLIIVAARPGVGKTSWAINVAMHAALKQRIPVLIFSLEMSKLELMERMLAGEARIDSSRLKKGLIEYSDWKNSIYPAGSRIAEAPILIDDAGAPTILDIRAKSRRFRHDPRVFKPTAAAPNEAAAKPGLGLIVVDYLQLARGTGGRREDSREREIAEISRGLKTLAKDLKVPIIAVSQLNRGIEKRDEKIPQLSDLRECVTGDTPVVLADGRRVPIRSLVGSTAAVCSVDETGRVIESHADKIWRVGRRQVLRFSLATGRTIRVTPEHRLLGARGWTRAKAFAAGDRIAIARGLPEPRDPERWPDLRVALLGQLIGDGSFLKRQPLRYTTSSEDNSTLVARAAREEFGANVKRYKGRGAWHQLLISGNGNRWHPRGVNLWLRKLGIFGQRSHEKRIPEHAFRLSNDQVALLLRHLWATDGTITPRRRGRGGHGVFFATSSPGLASDVAALLLRLGIVARIYEVSQGDHRPVHAVAISGVQNQQAFLDRVGAFGPRHQGAAELRALLAGKVPNTNVDTLPVEFFERVKSVMRRRRISQRAMASLRGTSYGGTSHFRFAPSRAVAAQYAALLEDPVLAAESESQLFWDRIVRIEPAGEEEVFDLTVPGTACWLADGIVSHNSGAIEQDADMIVFIHREEMYSPEAPRGKAELLIRKNRHGPTGSVPLTFIHEYTKFENYAADDDPGDYG